MYGRTICFHVTWLLAVLPAAIVLAESRFSLVASRGLSKVINGIRSTVSRSPAQSISAVDSKLLVTTIDGKMHMLDIHTGTVDWVFDSGAPLVHASKSSADFQGAIVPATDGRIVHIVDSTVNTLDIKAQDIVKKSPFVSNDGKSLFTGKKTTTLFVLDLKSGQSTMTLADQCPQPDLKSTAGLLSREERTEDDGQEIEDDLSVEVEEEEDLYNNAEEPYHDSQEDIIPEKDRPAMWVSRTDYAVRAFSTELRAQQFEFTYRDSLQCGDGVPVNLKDIDLVVGESGVLHYRERISGNVWSADLGSHIVNVLSPSTANTLPLKRLGHVQGSMQDVTVTSDVRGGDAADTALLRLDQRGEPFAVTGSLIDSFGFVWNEGEWQAVNNPGNNDNAAVIPFVRQLLDSEADSGRSGKCHDGSFLCLVGLLTTNLSTEAVLSRFDYIWSDPLVWLLTVLSTLLLLAVVFLMGTVYRQWRQIKSSADVKQESQTQNGTNEESTLARARRDSAGFICVGSLKLSDEILGYGSHGTVVYAGLLGNRQVAIKRMLRQFHSSADKEIQLLIHSDGHPNVVRYFAREVEGDFVYLALERCKVLTSNFLPKPLRRWLRELGSGVAHLHSLKILHRDLKPGNILISDEPIKGFYLGRPKISDMGLGKQLDQDQSSFGHSSFGLRRQKLNPGSNEDDKDESSARAPGSVGWQAPEIVALRGANLPFSEGSETSAEAPSRRHINGADDGEASDNSSSGRAILSKRTAAVDIFSLGCVFYTAIDSGNHPFGEWFERERNIIMMLDQEPAARPSAAEVVGHPTFWEEEKTIAFLQDLSDRLDKEDRNGPLIQDLESRASRVFPDCSWEGQVDKLLVECMLKYRRYNYNSLADFLRLFRNERHHYHELPQEAQQLLGELPEGFLAYFLNRFPSLLITCYTFASEYFYDEKLFQSYFGPASKRFALKAQKRQSGQTRSCILWRDRLKTPRGWLRPAPEWIADTSFRVRSALKDNLSRTDERYRTSFCANWMKSTGLECRFGARCAFAHGHHELRLFKDQIDRWADDGTPLPLLALGGKNGDSVASDKLPPKTKTKLCNFFGSPVGCRDGDNCRFIHIGVDVPHPDFLMTPPMVRPPPGPGLQRSSPHRFRPPGHA